MIQRFFRLIAAFFNTLLGRAEKANAHSLRDQKVNESAAKVAAAQRGLGALQGAVRECTREVSRLEGEAKLITGRKTHFLKAVKAATPNSPEATSAVGKAKEQHLALGGVNDELNAARTTLSGLTAEYESNKALVLGAQGDVKAARKKGKTLERKTRSAKRRSDLVSATSSLRGVSGLGDGLADLDDEIEAGIDALEGAAFVATEFADEANADRRLDAEIAAQESLGDFEAELAAMNETVPVVAATPAPSSTTVESSGHIGGESFDSGSGSSSGDTSSD